VTSMLGRISRRRNSSAEMSRGRYWNLLSMMLEVRYASRVVQIRQAQLEAEPEDNKILKVDGILFSGSRCSPI
jgi:hypothetical protein